MGGKTDSKYYIIAVNGYFVMKLLYYITSHGYGHASRAIAICNLLSPETSVVFRTTVPKKIFDEEVKRPFSLEPAEFDCGCFQTDGVTVDVKKTLDAYRAMADRNGGLLDKEANWCRENGVGVIASDIVPFAFEVAKQAGIPSVAATNFTWYSIYEGYSADYPEFSTYLEKIRRQYAMADLLLAMFPANEMPYFEKRVDTGPVGRAGADVRRRLIMENGTQPHKKIGMIYTGNFGMDAVSWKNIEKFGDWEFFGLYPLPGSPRNYHLIAKESFRYQDCIASADAMISKLGYGTCAECFINGLPIVYLPREHFAEFPVLHKAVSEWGHGYLLSKADYCSINWGSALRLIEKREKPAAMLSGGALRCAREIEKLNKDE
jgi:L-arabinokinase